MLRDTRTPNGESCWSLSILCCCLSTVPAMFASSPPPRLARPAVALGRAVAQQGAHAELGARVGQHVEGDLGAEHVAKRVLKLPSGGTLSPIKGSLESISRGRGDDWKIDG